MKKRSRPSFWDWFITFVKVGYFYLLIEFLVVFVQLAALRILRPPLTSFMIGDLNQCSFLEPCRIEKTWKDLSEISPFLKSAVLVAEDPHFYYHDGIDGDAIQRAMALNLKEKRIVRGASTLPQQLAKNLYLSSSKSILRKSKEMVIALFMDRVLSKQRILEIYLNVAEWGRGLYGAEAASRFYFQKPASMLSMQEAAYLASLLPNPVFYADPSHSAQTLEREGHILDALNDPRYQKQLEVP